MASDDHDDFDNERENQYIQQSRHYYQTLLNSQTIDSSDLNQNNQDFQIQEEEGEAEDQENQLRARDWQGDLIEEVRTYECVWNTRSKSFKDRFKKAEAWRRISMSLGQEGILLYI